MESLLTLSAAAQETAGALLLSLVFVEFGGTYVLRLVRKTKPATDFQVTFARAGHAHAGVLVTLALVCQVLADAAGVNGVGGSVARSGIPLAAVLMPAGFFLSSIGEERNEPNRLIVLIYAGAVSLAAGALALGIGLIR